MKLFLSNAFSLNMLKDALTQEGLTLRVRPVSLEEVKNLLGEGFISAVGHSATALLLTTLLGLPVEAQRIAITMGRGDRLIVFQLWMRLEEGRILNEEEVRALYEQGLASFIMVDVL
jgi:hypothetical protein